MRHSPFGIAVTATATQRSAAQRSVLLIALHCTAVLMHCTAQRCAALHCTALHCAARPNVPRRVRLVLHPLWNVPLCRCTAARLNALCQPTLTYGRMFRTACSSSYTHDFLNFVEYATISCARAAPCARASLRIYSSRWPNSATAHAATL